MSSLVPRLAKPTEERPLRRCRMKWAVCALVFLLVVWWFMPPVHRIGPDLSDLSFAVDGDIPDYCARELGAMAEPSLLKLAGRDKNAAAYRFLCVPSFDSSFAVRATRTARGAELRLVELSLESGTEVWSVARNVSERASSTGFVGFRLPR